MRIWTAGRDFRPVREKTRPDLAERQEIAATAAQAEELDEPPKPASPDTSPQGLPTPVESSLI
jgi:hypothetical protein